MKRFCHAPPQHTEEDTADALTPETVEPPALASSSSGLGPHDYLSVSTSTTGPRGPWHEQVIMQSEPADPAAWNCNKSNPAPLVLPNGTVLLMYRGQPCVRDPHCRNATANLCEHQGIAVAVSVDGPYHDRQGKIDALSGNEDAILFRTRRGFAALFHSKNACGQSD